MKFSIFRNTLFFAISTYLFSCTSGMEHEKTVQVDPVQFENVTESISSELFRNSDSTYGFNIKIDNKIYIHQPIIPIHSGWTGFSTPESASNVARFLIARLNKKYAHFILEPGEMDSLLEFSNALGNQFQQNRTSLLQKALNTAFSFSLNSDSEKNNSYILPALPEPPLKVSWRSLGKVPFGKRSITFSFSIGDLVFIGAGEHNDEGSNDFWVYNTQADYWTSLASMPGIGRIGGISFSLKGKGYIGLGAKNGMATSSYRNDLYEYDPALNIWSEKAVFPGLARVDASYFVINEKAYAGLGNTGINQKDFYEFDPDKNSWRKIHDFDGGATSAAAGISMLGKGFITCGAWSRGYSKTLYEYIPITDHWELKEDFPGIARYYVNGHGIDSNLFIAVGGRGDGGAIHYNDCYLFNAKTGKWSGLPAYLTGPEGISRTGGGSVKGNIYMGTGFNGFFRDDWNVFEYYFSARKDTGIYDEGVCYPLRNDDNWEVYQECTGVNCYVGIAIKANEDLGDLCYNSKVENSINTEFRVQNKRIFIMPRMFRISTAKKPTEPYSIRLFFPRKEFDHIANLNRDSSAGLQSPGIKILIYDQIKSALTKCSDEVQIMQSRIIPATLYGYGFGQETWVADIMVDSKDFILRIAVIED
jgi:N-acetylneuraminic acid mutarotase